MSIKQKVARKAVKKTAKHTARGAASKIKRDPMRSTALRETKKFCEKLRLGDKP